MSSKIKTYRKDKIKILATVLGAWTMVIGTLIGTSSDSKISRQPVVLNMARPSYAYVTPGPNTWARNDSENETVHMPTEFDIGIHIVGIGGRK